MSRKFFPCPCKSTINISCFIYDTKHISVTLNKACQLYENPGTFTELECGQMDRQNRIHKFFLTLLESITKS